MDIIDFFVFILELINRIVVPLIFAAAFLVFIVGIFRTFFSDSEDKRKEGRKLAVYGVVGFFIMLSVWGLVNILVGTFGFGGQGRPPLPSFGSPGGSSVSGPRSPADCPDGTIFLRNAGGVSGRNECRPIPTNPTD